MASSSSAAAAAAAAPALTIQYFDTSGRAETSRLTAALGGVALEDVRLAFPEFMQRKADGQYPLGSVPVLSVDGADNLSQSPAIARYLARLGGLYPEDPLQGLVADEALAVCEEMWAKLYPSIFMKGEEQRAAREDFCDFCRRRFGLLDRRAGEHGSGGHYVGSDFTVADTCIASIVGTMTSGNLDHVPADIVSEENFPALKAVHDAVMAHPNVVTYRERVAADKAAKEAAAKEGADAAKTDG